MTLQQMEYIVALDKYRHFVLAAEACGVTQPTLSAMIQKLEEELDVKIFSRDRKNITPTSIGEKIIRQAKIALNETQKIKEVVADESSNMNGNLRIGILPTIAPYLVPDFIYYFRKSYPNVNLFIDEKENRSLIQDLRFGNLDIAITTPPEAHANILEIPVYVEKFVAYFSETCSKARQMIVNGNLPPEQMWILKEGHCIPNGGINLCENKDIGNHIYEAGSIDTLIKIVDRNGGYTIIPELHISTLNEKQKENIQTLNVNPPAQRTVSILIKDDFIRERIVNAVLDTIKAIIPSHMMDERFKTLAIKLR
ncbi:MULTISPECIES: LysR substrate-binding domain-containing protein [unclassified Phocaeicola]|jgi:LysR family hydrogen peroxide-inducible transcriptional activator|uniref:LysR substrate-binding domain-containing protein n=1 Tax=unclassified Phocaeicola TaxID=2762211 RepID=UPI0003404267|nr:transcriptional regulator LysR family [Bacteroides sp. CAG:1076]